MSYFNVCTIFEYSCVKSQYFDDYRQAEIAGFNRLQNSETFSIYLKLQDIFDYLQDINRITEFGWI